MNNQCRPNVNAYWGFVRDQFPDARFDFWYRAGELHFFRDGDHERSGESPWSCIRDDFSDFIICIES